MRIKALLTTAVAAALVLSAPTAAFADVTHESSLAGNIAEVTVDAAVENAGLQASVVLMPAGIRYSDPRPSDIVFLSEYTLDENGRMTFTATVPDGDLDDYVLAVNVAGETGRYLASLDPNGPVPVDPPVIEPPSTDPPPTDPPGTDPPVTDPPTSDSPSTNPPAPAAGAIDGDSGDDHGSGSDDPLAFTGGAIATGAIAVGLCLLAAGMMLLTVRRRKLRLRD